MKAQTTPQFTAKRQTILNPDGTVFATFTPEVDNSTLLKVAAHLPQLSAKIMRELTEYAKTTPLCYIDADIIISEGSASQPAESAQYADQYSVNA